MTQIIRITPEETLDIIDTELSKRYNSYHPDDSIKPREKTYYCVFEKWSPVSYNIETVEVSDPALPSFKYQKLLEWIRSVDSKVPDDYQDWDFYITGESGLDCYIIDSDGDRIDIRHHLN